MNDLFRLTYPEDSLARKKELRPHQSKAMDMIRQSFGKGKRRTVLQAATGFGKTVVAAGIVESALAKGKQVLFTVPRITLVDQAVAEFEGQGITHIGVIQADHPRRDDHAPVQVASTATLARRGLPDKPGLVIVDECHLRAQAVEDMVAEWPDLHMVGLSATPWAKGMGLLWQDLVIPITIAELIEQGYLSRFVVYAPDVPDMTGVKTVAGDYHEGETAEAMSEGKLVANVVQTWLEKGEGRPTLVFGVNCAHAQVLQAEFERAGVCAGYCDAYTDRAAMQLYADRFRAGEYQVFCSVRKLTTGVDWAVSCIVDAAPTKSESLHVQKIGRGMRVNPGTEDCLSADTNVLTDKGLCKIKDITLDHKVWDGVSFVHHGGAVCRGRRAVIRYDGLTGTPDHRVMTEYGWRTLDEAASGRLRIARTGIGRFPLRFLGDYFSQGGRAFGQTEGGGQVRPLRASAHGALSQHQEATEHEGVSELQWTSSGDGPEVALCEVPSATESLPEPKVSLFCELWGARDRISLREPECCGDMGCGDAWCGEPVYAAGSGRQRRALRAGESALGASCAEHGQQQAVEGVSGPVSRISAGVPGSQVFRPLAGGHDPARDDGFRDRTEMGGVSGQQSYEEVWDILNAGQLQRFTANGRLVHNCLILDHAGNSLRLGLVTDIHHDTLDATAKGAQEVNPKAEKLPKECANCGALHAGRICPFCGHERKPVPGVETVDGELVELAGKKAAPTKEEKERWMRGLMWFARNRGYKEGWAARKYRDKFGVWPQNVSREPQSPDQDIRNWVKAKQIAFAKAKAKQKVQA